MEWPGEVAPTTEPLAELAALLERERDTARAQLLAALDSHRWDRLVTALEAMVQQGPMRRSVATRLPAVIGVPALVEARHQAVVKAGKRAKRTDLAPDFHRLRKRAKRLRYSLEFTTGLYGARTSRYIRRLTALQDQLGLMQDAEVASARLADLATGETQLPAATVFVMGGMAERHRRDMARLLRVLPGEVSRVGGREWRELSEHMARRHDDAAAQLPPVRRTLRAVPSPPAGSETEAPAAVHPSAGTPGPVVVTEVVPIAAPGAGEPPGLA
jgi:hypothetical protein